MAIVTVHHFIHCTSETAAYTSTCKISGSLKSALNCFNNRCLDQELYFCHATVATLLLHEQKSVSSHALVIMM